MLKLLSTDQITPTTPFVEVQGQAFALLERPRLDRVADYIVTQARFDETAFEWAHVDTLARRFKQHRRPLLRAVDLTAIRAQTPLLEAVRFLKASFAKDRPLRQVAAAAVPTRCIPVRLKRYLYEPDPAGGKRLLADRYEFLVYRLLRQGLEAGDIFCRDSVRFRSFEDDLVDDRQWRDKDTLLAAAGLSHLLQPIQERLADLERRLDERLLAVNRCIAVGENPMSRSHGAERRSAGRCSIRRWLSRSTIPSSRRYSRWISATCSLSWRGPARSWPPSRMSWGATSNRRPTTASSAPAWWPGAPTWAWAAWARSPT